MSEETIQLNFEINWNEAACRAIMIKKLSEVQVKELHELENTRCKRYYGYKGPNWLIAPFEIRKLYYPELKNLTITEKDVETVIMLIKNLVPRNIQGWGSYTASVEFQHAFDWNVFHKAAKFYDNRSSKKNHSEEEEVS